MELESKPTSPPSLVAALFPVLLLIGLLVVNVFIYSDDASYGPNQIALLIAAVTAGTIGYFHGVSVKNMLEGINTSLGSAIGAILILLLVGSLMGTWLISGIIPLMIYYGLEVLNPTIFLVAAVIVCAVVSLATGSSWSTVGTVGVALLGIGQALGLGTGMIVGAIISGAYFGDKMSPLSDTTNLAPAMAGTELFTHIKYMLYTTVPSLVITLVFFLVMGLNSSVTETASDSLSLQTVINEEFNLSPLLLIVPAVVLVLVLLKFDAVVALFFGAILAAVFAVIFQPNTIDQVATQDISNAVAEKQDQLVLANALLDSQLLNEVPEAEIAAARTGIEELKESIEEEEAALEAALNGNYLKRCYVAIVNSMFGEVALSTQSGDSDAEDLLQSKGMAGMLNTIWLIIVAMCFGGVMEACGLLKRITDPLVGLAKSDGALFATTGGSCMFTNLTASDQYLSIVVPGRMFRETYTERGLAPENLSRTLEDTGTVTSALVPWNTCAAFHSGVLSVSPYTFIPFCIFNIVSPLMTMFYGFFGIGIRRITKKNSEETEAADS